MARPGVAISIIEQAQLRDDMRRNTQFNGSFGASLAPPVVITFVRE